jgi:esterase/lipase superfamily enzyme
MIFKKVLIGIAATSIFIFIQMFSLYPAYFLPLLDESIFESTHNYDVNYINIDNKNVKFISFNKNKGCPLIVYYHGNNELVDHHVGYFNYLTTEFCLNAVLIEYNGYGNSEGFPSVESSAKNTKYWLDKNYSGEEDLIIWGRSIGSAHAFNFLENYPSFVDKVIIHAGFNDPSNVLTDNDILVSILEPLSIVNYNVESKIENLVKNKDLQLLIFHGDNDHLFSTRVPEKLHSIFSEKGILSKVHIYNGGHNLIPKLMGIEAYNFIREYKKYPIKLANTIHLER